MPPASVMESPIVPFMCQEPHYSSPASSRIELLHACAFKISITPFIRVQKSHFSVHGYCTVSSVHSFTFKLLSFIFVYSEVSLLPVCIFCGSVAQFLHLRGSHHFISTRLTLRLLISYIYIYIYQLRSYLNKKVAAPRLENRD